MVPPVCALLLFPCKLEGMPRSAGGSVLPRLCHGVGTCGVEGAGKHLCVSCMIPNNSMLQYSCVADNRGTEVEVGGQMRLWRGADMLQMCMVGLPIMAAAPKTSAWMSSMIAQKLITDGEAGSADGWGNDLLRTSQ